MKSEPTNPNHGILKSEMSEFQVTCILEEDSAFELLLTLFFS